MHPSSVSSSLLRVWLIDGPHSPPDLEARLRAVFARGVAVSVFEEVSSALLALHDGPPPSALLVDGDRLGGGAIVGLARLCAAAPRTPSFLLTEDPLTATRPALHAGAWGCLRRGASAEAIAGAVHAALEGAVLVPRPVARDLLAIPAASEGYGLTGRERDVLGLLVEGKSQKAVADALFLSPATVNSHVQRIYAKLGVRSATGAVAKAVREGLT